jgi:hypothetical protein
VKPLTMVDNVASFFFFPGWNFVIWLKTPGLWKTNTMKITLHNSLQTFNLECLMLFVTTHKLNCYLLGNNAVYIRWCTATVHMQSIPAISEYAELVGFMKYRYTCIKLHGATVQRIVTFISTPPTPQITQNSFHILLERKATYRECICLL